MEIPHHMFMSHRFDIAKVCRFLRPRRIFPLNRAERYRAIHALFKINTAEIMRRAVWTIRVATEKGETVIFRWCPRKDPIETPM